MNRDLNDMVTKLYEIQAEMKKLTIKLEGLRENQVMLRKKIGKILEEENSNGAESKGKAA